MTAMCSAFDCKSRSLLGFRAAGFIRKTNAEMHATFTFILIISSTLNFRFKEIIIATTIK